MRVGFSVIKLSNPTHILFVASFNNSSRVVKGNSIRLNEYLIA